MNNEIFKRNGALRARPPKKYECRDCGHLTSKPPILRLYGVSFYICGRCTGRIKERETYKEWEKRKSGQWDIEKRILALLADADRELTKDEISKQMMDIDDFLFSKSFSELCYWGKIHINTKLEPIKYSAKTS